jgi:subtilisin family serine protease
MKTRISRRNVAAAAIGLFAALLAGTASAAPERVRLNQALPGDASRKVEVFVQLATPSVAELNIQSMDTSGTMAAREAQVRQAALVDAEQGAFRQQLASFDAQELGALRVGANGLRVLVRADQVEALKALPGVRTVGRVEIHTLDNIESVPWIGSKQVWDVYKAKGEHIKIGIIDTGIDYLHADFGGPGTKAAYDANNKNIVEPGSFPTAKVKGGIDFAGATYDPNDPKKPAVPDADPLDGNGHGTHVAGTAAGLGVADVIGPGVAPAADLYAIKVFNDTSGVTDLTSQGIEWALDPNGDGCMEDHLDVINMSLGSPFGEPNDPSALASQRASKLGIVVVASAGNEANVPYVTGAPAVAPAAISVAATTPGGRVYSRVNVTAPANLAGFKSNVEGAGPVQLKKTGPISGVVVQSDSPPAAAVPPAPAPTLRNTGCNPFANAAEINGNIALVRRGDCTFAVKFANAQAAGARAIIVYNSSSAAPITMGLAGTETIPGVMITQATGNALSTAAGLTKSGSTVQVTLDAAPDPTKDDQIVAFSSRGPGHGGTTFKPDLSAPGVAIVSAGAGTGNGSANFSGTSMAAPHIAGAAALLRQIHPQLSPRAIKALLLNSTVNSNVSGDTDLAREGVGVVRVDRAAALTSYASPGGVSFGRINPTHTVARSTSVRLTDFSGKARTFSVQTVPHRSYPGVQVSCPSSVSVPANRSRKFELNLSFDPAVALTKNVGEDWFHSEAEVDGWCVLSDGTDTLRVGYLASVDAASRVDARDERHGALTIANSGPAVGLVEEFTSIGGRREHDDGDDSGDDHWRQSNDGWDHDGGGDDSAEGARRIDQLGVRTNVVAGYNVVEFGMALSRAWEHISNVEVDLYLDTDKDGKDDVLLLGIDGSFVSSTIPVGTYVTAQIDLATGDGFIDWEGVWDFNDRVAFLTYTSTANKPADAGLVPSSFNYRMEIHNRDGTGDTVRGTVDLAREVVPDLNDFTLAPGEKVNIKFSRRGKSLWLYPGNTVHNQFDVVRVENDRHDGDRD